MGAEPHISNLTDPYLPIQAIRPRVKREGVISSFRFNIAITTIYYHLLRKHVPSVSDALRLRQRDVTRKTELAMRDSTEVPSDASVPEAPGSRIWI